MIELNEQLAKEFNISLKQVEDTLGLIDEGNTIPFIARYRKEVTGNLDDVLLRDLNTRLEYLRKLMKRKEEISGSIEEQNKMTPELVKAISLATTLQEVEDIYLPYKKKRTTRASVAKEKGLEPLALVIIEQEKSTQEIEKLAMDYVDADKNVETPEIALAGAMDIVAEMISDNGEYRSEMRNSLRKNGHIRTKVTKDFSEVKTEFDKYYDYFEPLDKIANHRVMAMNRGEKKKILSVKLEDKNEGLLVWLKKKVIKKQSNQWMITAIEDSYKRLIFPAVEREVRKALKEEAEASSIKNFGINLKKLLMQPPFRDKVTMGFDPGVRTGCKIAVLDTLGTLKETATIYPTLSSKIRIIESEKKLLELIKRHKVDIIAIGNGTASRESTAFVADAIKKIDRKVEYLVVDEAGASIYSASELATKEYPQIDVSLRGAISIGGRLQDPLSELVKIEPQHIGVGQYQHDVNQKELEKVLEATVEDTVNQVGVNVNRASISLLKQVSGINQTIAANIIQYRETNGRFSKREEIKKVKGLGAKAYEQAAGFLRIQDGDNILDNTGVHPESYKATDALLQSLDLSRDSLLPEHIKETREQLKSINYSKMADQLGIGEPTLKDIVKELEKPGRDPRDNAPKPHLKSDVLAIEDLKEDMELTGTVRNVIDFGAFVDIGVHQDGLVHISEISDRFIKHPSEVLSIGDVVTVRVLSVDVDRKRIGLSMRL